ncbi:DUF2501 domain-containing protein [Pseudoxanthomonas sp.]|uniref:DUF2501 domain-containing protein n=1 Tax=Pseudoxanthomonas sp. TaxID=1871049 RepID=UPI002615211C|nr:DUF2501 domain-containing protein [Pseudoxanthomonas sp.]WDS35687.1 MAG: DUF2501 domain-containing protein [Pseudoxanthomonas sp.]
MKRSALVALVLASLGVAAASQAQDLGKLLKKEGGQASSQTEGSSSGGLASMLGGSAMPALSGDNAGSAAGVLQYCVKRKYLSADAVTSVKDKLLSKYNVGGDKPATESADYKSGTMGLLKGDGGKSFNLDSVSGKVKDKACDYVLDNATKLI